MSEIVSQAVARLRDVGVTMEPGLSGLELSQVEERFGAVGIAEVSMLPAPSGTKWLSRPG